MRRSYISTVNSLIPSRLQPLASKGEYICSDERNCMKIVSGIILVGLVIFSPRHAQSQTNDITGPLGYRIGTQLTIDGSIPTRPMMCECFDVYRVNETELQKPITVQLEHTHGMIEALGTNRVCRLRGREEQTPFFPSWNTGTGLASLSQGSGKPFRFVISEVLSPPGIQVDKYGNWRRSEQHDGPNRSPSEGSR